MDEFYTYIEKNAGMVINYGKRWRQGKRISTAIIESLVNSFLGKRFSKKQQMQWSKSGAHLLLQVRAKVINHELKVERINPKNVDKSLPKKTTRSEKITTSKEHINFDTFFNNLANCKKS